MVIARLGGSFRPSPREVGFGDLQCRADTTRVHCDLPYQAAVLLLAAKIPGVAPRWWRPQAKLVGAGAVDMKMFIIK